jgi:outer membrane protein OmpA-like peptidoglycan-associated protein
MDYLKISILVCSVLLYNLAFTQIDSSQTKLYFQFNSFKLNDSAKNKLNDLIKNDSAEIIYKINGYTDQVGSLSYNDTLSVKRANSVFNYLVLNGINAKRVSEIIGFGKRRFQSYDTLSIEKNNQLNRYVSIWFFKKIENKNSIKDTLSKIGTIKLNIPSQVENNIKVNSFENRVNSGDSVIILENLNFQKNRHILLGKSIPLLGEVLMAMKNNDSLKIEIQGHICCIDSNEFDGLDFDTDERSLSINRARAVYDYLVSHGIQSTRLSYKGFGSKKRLVFPELTEMDAIKNRRVEFKILKK